MKKVFLEIFKQLKLAITTDYTHKQGCQTIIWKMGAMIVKTVENMDGVGAEIAALEAESAGGERTTRMEQREEWRETLDDQVSELEALIPAAKDAYKEYFREDYQERARVSKPRSSRVKALLEKKAAAAA